MPGRRRIPDDSMARVKAVMERTQSKIEYQRALAVWLRAALGLTDPQVAIALGWRVRTVRAAYSRFFRQGENSFQGGRSRLAEGQVERLREQLKRATSVSEFRRLQCLWLGQALGLDSAQVATAIGVSCGHVRGLRSRYRHKGEGALESGGGQPALDPAAAAELRAAMKQARSVPAFRRALCLWLRLVQGFNGEQAAAALGWTASAVSVLYRRYLRNGLAALDGPGRGGRRHQLFNKEQEAALLRRLCQEAWPSSIVFFQAVHQAVEKEAGRPVKASTVRQILERHGWGPAYTVVIPKHDIPEGLSAEALAARRSGPKGVWYVHLEDPEEWFETVRQAKGKTTPVQG